MTYRPLYHPGLGRNIRALLSGFFSFEVLFVLFLFAGRYKNDPRLDWIPVDLTFLFLVLSVVSALSVLIRRRFSLPIVPLAAEAWLLMMIAWMTISLAFSPSRAYAIDKLLLFGVLSVWAFMGSAFIVGPNPRRLRRFLTLLVLLGVVMAVESLIELSATGTGQFLHTFGSTYIGIGRTLGLAFVPTFALLMSHPLTSAKSLMALILSTLFVVVMYFSGARGPMLALLFSILVSILYASRYRLRSFILRRANRRAIWITVITLLLPTIALLQMDLGARTITRFNVLFESEGGGVSASARLHNYEQALKHISDSPFIGHGIGSFPMLLGLSDQRGYPHNLFLEVWVELGLIGLVLFLLFVFASLQQPKRVPSQGAYLSLSLVMLLANAFANAMISGDLSDNRLLLMALGLIAGARPSVKLMETRTV